MDTLPYDIRCVLMKMVSPSSFLCLSRTCKAFQVVEKKLVKYDIICDACSNTTADVINYLDKIGISQYVSISILSITPEVLKWLLEKRYYYYLGPNDIEVLFRERKVEHLTVLYDNWYTDKKSLHTLATEYGLLAILKHADPHQYNPDYKYISKCASEKGYLDVLDWLYSKWVIKLDQVFYAGIKEGQLEVVKWVISRTGRWCFTNNIALLAANSGHLHIIEWAHKQGYPLTYPTYRAAVQRSDTKMITWLYEHGCPTRK